MNIQKVKVICRSIKSVTPNSGLSFSKILKMNISQGYLQFKMIFTNYTVQKSFSPMTFITKIFLFNHFFQARLTFTLNHMAI